MTHYERTISRCGLATVFTLAIAASPAGTAQTSVSGADLVRVATELVDQQASESVDRRAPPAARDAARCVAVFPDVFKAGFVVAAQSGKGLVSCRNAATRSWGAPAYYEINAASVGLQAGYERASFVMLFLTEEAVDTLRKPTTKIGAGASFAAGEVGSGAKLDAQTAVVSYSRSKGMFAGIDLSGATLVYDKPATTTAYGAALSVAKVLHGNVPVPESLTPLVRFGVGPT